MKRIGNRIRKVREGQGLTQADVARRARVDPSMLSRLEAGKLPDVTVKTLKKVASALSISLDDLIGRSYQRLISCPDFVLRSPQPFGEADIHRRIEDALAAGKDGNVCALVEQFRDGDDYVVAIEVRQVKSDRRVGGGDVRRSGHRTEQVIAAALKDPRLGCERLSYELLKEGTRISSTAVQNKLNAEGLSTRQDRAKRLHKDAQEGKIVPTKKQQDAINRVTGSDE